MTYKSVYFLFLFVLFIVPKSFCNSISMEDFIRNASNNSFAIKSALHNLKENKLLKDLNLLPETTVLQFSQKYKLYPILQKDNFTTKAELIKNDTNLGMIYSFAIIAEKNNSREQSLMSVTAEKSLWKNFSGKKNKIIEDKTNLDIKQNELEILNIYEDIIESLILDYIEWQMYFIQIQEAQEELNTFEKIYSNIKKRHQQSIAHINDVKKAEYQILLKKEKILKLDEYYKNAQTKIKYLLDTSEEIKPLTQIIERYKDIDFTKYNYTQNIEHNRTLKIFDIKDKKNYFNLQLNQEENKGEFSIFASYEHDFSSGLTFKHGAANPYIGLKFSYQLDNPHKKSQLKKIYLEKEKNFLDKQKQKNNLENELSKLRKTINTQLKIIDLQSQKNKVSKEILNEELRRYEYGDVEIQAVINSEARYIENKYILLKNKINLTKTYLKWMNRSDILVSKLP